MGVYINMEMPEEDKEVIIRISSDGMVMTEYALPIPGLKAVPVPPHGRCVDADKLMQEMRLFIKENMLSRDDARELIETIEDAPTVLEAEDGE